MYTRTLAHGVIVDGAEQGTGGIYHSSRRIVHRTDELAQIGSGNVVAWKVMQGRTVHDGLPLAVFQSFHTFKVEDVGIGALDTKGFQSV